MYSAVIQNVDVVIPVIGLIYIIRKNRNRRVKKALFFESAKIIIGEGIKTNSIPVIWDHYGGSDVFCFFLFFFLVLCVYHARCKKECCEASGAEKICISSAVFTRRNCNIRCARKPFVIFVSCAICFFSRSFTENITNRPVYSK